MDLTGRRLGAYALKHKLGQGGMGAVYLGLHLALDRERAIKVLLEHDADASIVERLRREALVAASLKHPNIVEIFDVDERDGIHFIVMESVASRTDQDGRRADA
jgi:serine/threonine protein kinase